jgi:hypothetical protein
MLEELIKLVKENAGDAIVKNPAIPNEHNEAAIQTAAGGIMNQLKSLITNGNLEKLKEIFSQGNISGSPVVSNISKNVSGDLMSKFGINHEQANNITKDLIPNVMGQLVKKTNDPTDKTFDLQAIIGTLTSGQGSLGNIMNSVKGMFGS